MPLQSFEAGPFTFNVDDKPHGYITQPDPQVEQYITVAVKPSEFTVLLEPLHRHAENLRTALEEQGFSLGYTARSDKEGKQELVIPVNRGESYDQDRLVAAVRAFAESAASQFKRSEAIRNETTETVAAR